MATAKLPEQVDPMLSFFLPTKTQVTRAPGDMGPVNNVLAQLQGEDYNNLIQAMFQQVMDNTPGLMTQYARATGARSSGNSQLKNALAAEGRRAAAQGAGAMATARNQNLTTQAGLASEVFRGTGGHTTSTPFDLGGAAQRMLTAKGAGMLQDWWKRKDSVTATAGLSGPMPESPVDFWEMPSFASAAETVSPLGGIGDLALDFGAADAIDAALGGTDPFDWLSF